MFNPINAVKVNNQINNWSVNANETLTRLKKERGRMHVRIEETRLHDADANATYKRHLDNINAMIDSIELAIDTIGKNKAKIVIDCAARN